MTQSTENAETRAWVLHPDIPATAHGRDAKLALAEAESLAHALPGLTVVGAELVRLPKPHPGTLFGKGKLAELKARIEAEEIGLVLIDGPVSPVQQRNLEREWGVKLLDRTGLILEIFSDRAATREGVLQVEMAALSYQRTRLVRAWTHLERQRGGLGFVGGPGETQIEADRRAIDEQLVRLRRQLEKVVRTRELHRAARAKVPFPIVALVGYTNAGKSTLFNRMTGAEVMAKDMLFATLDTTTRAIELPDGQPLLLTDTVGFVRNLPHRLVEAFKATLEESVLADFIIHVLDASAPEVEKYYQTTMEVLTELGAGDKPMITVLNKIDILNDPVKLAGLEVSFPNTVSVSAITGQGVDALLTKCSEMLADRVRVESYRIPQSRGDLTGLLHRDAKVLETEYDGNDMIVRVVVPASIAGKLETFRV